MTRRLKSTALALLRWLCSHWPRSGRVRRILLDARSPLIATYLEDLREVFAHDKRLRFFKTVRPNLPAADRERSLVLLNCPEITYRIAKFYPWDLIVLADHPTDHIEDLSAKYGVLRISHGLGSKLVNGQDYFYGPALYARTGRLRYSCIFESSESRMAKFTFANPDLRGVVKLVGDLRIDKLRRVSDRAENRPTASARPSVVFAGSWSSGNLFEKLGPELFDEAAGLLDRYAFVIRPHPHVFNEGAVAHAGANQPGKWRAFFEEQRKRGFVLSPPTDDPGWLLSAASVVICDDLTSMVLYAAALGKRIIMVRSGSDQVPPEAFCARLAGMVPNLTRATELGETLAAVMNGSSPAAVGALAAEINSHPGQSARLVQNELYRLLNLVPLAESARLMQSANVPTASPPVRFRPPEIVEPASTPGNQLPVRTGLTPRKNP